MNTNHVILSKTADTLPTPILVTGSKGMLGWELIQILDSLYDSSEIIGFDYEDLNITSEKEVADFFKARQPKLIFNAAAYTNVDAAETEREEAYRVNVLGPRILTAACQKHSSTLVHFSTDQVFDGSGDRLWKETDEPHPCNYYAQTKLLGEQEVLSYKNALVLRVQWLYGTQRDRFTSLKNKKSFTPFRDQFGAPTWTKDVIHTLVELLSKDVRGLYHFAYDDHASWAEVFQFVVDEMNYPTKLFPQATDSIKLPAQRPKFIAFSNSKLLQALGRTKMGSWKDSLKNFLNEQRDTK